MKILFLMLSFPDLRMGTNMYTNLVQEFAKNGHEIYCVAPMVENDRTRIVNENGVNVLRVKTMRLFNVNPIKKGIANLLLPYQYKKAINKFYSKVHFDLVIMPTPPITLVNVVKNIKKKYGSKMYLILRDIFPQNAVDLGMLSKKSPLYWMFRRQEKKLYSVSDYLGCMSQGNINYILEHNPKLNKNKLHILHNFQKLDNSTGINEEINAKYNFQGKFTVLFGGNLGVSQKVENIIDLAKECEEYDDVVFLIVGDGTHKEKIEKMARVKGVDNLIFKDFMPQKDYHELVAQCDIGLISLNERFTIPNIPSKTLSYFNLSLPILASLDPNTDYGKILEEANAGFWSLAGDTKSLKSNFDRLYHNPSLRKSMGKNGRKYFIKNMTVEAAYKVIRKFM